MSTAILRTDSCGIRQTHAALDSVLLVDCEIQRADGIPLQLRSVVITRGEDGFQITTVVVFGGLAGRGCGSSRFGERHRLLLQAMTRLDLDLSRPHPEQEAVRRDILFVERLDPDMAKTGGSVLSGLFGPGSAVALAEAIVVRGCLAGRVDDRQGAQTEIRAEAASPKGMRLLSVEVWPGCLGVRVSALVKAWMGEPVDDAGLVWADPVRQIALEGLSPRAAAVRAWLRIRFLTVGAGGGTGKVPRSRWWFLRRVWPGFSIVSSVGCSTRTSLTGRA